MSQKNEGMNIGVLTSGGDAQGMNAAVRAAVRTGLNAGVQVFAIYEGYQGMVDGGEFIRPMGWDDVGGVLNMGGTVLGTARSEDFRQHHGRVQAAHNLLKNNISRLVVIGGDGSLTGADLFRQEWPAILEELVESGQITPETAAKHPQLILAGLVGSIDNDMFGTDMTIGADSALHRITEAIDAITSTAASHQRSFVVEVMGRHCGYLALMSGIATGANWLFIPEHPPTADDWQTDMCEALQASRKSGRRHSIVIVAEGATDKHGRAISSEEVRTVISERLGEEARVTILGHVQRGGVPTAFDRNLSTRMGYEAVQEVLEATPASEPQLIGIRNNKIIRSPLMACVAQTKEIATVIAQHDYDKAMALRGGSFAEAYKRFHTLLQAQPRPAPEGQKGLRLAIMHCGGPAPGMNTAVRTAVRIALDQGHTIFGIKNGIRGLVKGQISQLDWMSVHGWVGRGGAFLGTSRKLPQGSDFYDIARQLDAHKIDGLLMIGGWTGYKAIYDMIMRRNEFAAFRIPIACLPASINNNLPGSEYSIGSDTALNSITNDVDRIKQSAVASQRCFVVEVMGRDCGYLALMGGLATGAERVYIPEEGITLDDLQQDVVLLKDGFEHGKQLGLIIRNENAQKYYTTDFICALLEKEGGDLFDVRRTILGHVQQGGNPTPFDRIQATRMATRCIEFLQQTAEKGETTSTAIGLQSGNVTYTNMEDFPRVADETNERPRDQWWMTQRPLARLMAQPRPRYWEKK